MTHRAINARLGSPLFGGVCITQNSTMMSQCNRNDIALPQFFLRRGRWSFSPDIATQELLPDMRRGAARSKCGKPLGS